MRIDILTLFPGQLEKAFQESIIKIAQEKGLMTINVVNWRQFATDKHLTVDDRPYGGGSGMVIKVDILDQALETLKASLADQKPYIILLTPGGQTFHQAQARSLAEKAWIILICGHYEGFDQRVHDHLVDQEISVGDFVLSGGEPAAWIVTDAITRLIPGVLGNENSNKAESFSTDSLDYPQFTRPESYQGWEVPPILLSGDHKQIEKWREQKAGEETSKKRPDLLKKP